MNIQRRVMRMVMNEKLVSYKGNWRMSGYKWDDLENIIPFKYQKYHKYCQVEKWLDLFSVTPEGCIRTSGWSYKEADLGSA